MVKKKGKGKKGKKGKKKPEGDFVLEVEKQFYELDINDINKKITRLQLLSTKLVEENAEIEKNTQKLIEEKDEIIISIKRTLIEKQSEHQELKENLKAAEESKVMGVEEHEKRVEEMNQNFEICREELTAEIKLLTGKLNALEEFRLNRDELRQRYEDQERFIEEQELKFKRLLYDIEKKFIMGKDSIRKEVEKEIYALGIEFEVANEIRIAPTTQRVIRENNAINHEIHLLSITNNHLDKENRELKAQSVDYTEKCKQCTNECKKYLNDSLIHKGIIERLTEEHNKLLSRIPGNEILIAKGKQCERDLRDLLKKEQNLLHKMRTLEQNYHACRSAESILKAKSEEATACLNTYRTILFEVTVLIKSILRLEKQELSPEEKKEKYNKLFIELNTTLSEAENEIKATSIASFDTIKSASSIYARGDLGFMPKIHRGKPPQPMQAHVASQMGRSFESLVNAQIALEKLMYEQMLEEMEGESIRTIRTEELDYLSEGAKEESEKEEGEKEEEEKEGEEEEEEEEEKEEEIEEEEVVEEEMVVEEEKFIEGKEAYGEDGDPWLEYQKLLREIGGGPGG